MEAARLQIAFVNDMLEMLCGELGFADIELHTGAPTDAWSHHRVPQKLQAAGDLGSRLLHALGGALADGRPRSMVVGSDAPTLPAACLRELLSSAAEVSLGPAADGGYYAIACRRIHVRMFDGVDWSGPEALEGTKRSVRAAGLTVAVGREWFDVDTPGDLDRLLASPDLPRHTAAWSKTIGQASRRT